MEVFKEDMTSNVHPAQLAVEALASQVPENNLLHCQQLENWYKDYAALRGPHLFKPTVELCFAQRDVGQSCQQ